MVFGLSRFYLLHINVLYSLKWQTQKKKKQCQLTIKSTQMAVKWW